MARVENTVNKIYAKLLQNDAYMGKARQSSISVASTESVLSLVHTNEDDAWELLKRELLAENISTAQVTAFREDIIAYLKRLIQDGLPSDLTVTETANIYQGKGVYRLGPALPELAQDCNLVPQQPTGAGLTLLTTHWSEWSFGIPEVSSPKGSSGIYNGSHASIMLLDFKFSAPWQHRHGVAHVYVTIENRTTLIHGTGLKRKILAIEPSARTGGHLIPGSDSEMGKLNWVSLPVLVQVFRGAFQRDQTRRPH